MPRHRRLRHLHLVIAHAARSLTTFWGPTASQRRRQHSTFRSASRAGSRRIRPPFPANALFPPTQALLHPHALADALAALLPAGFAAPIAILRNWTYAVFYTMAELWGSVVVSLLFWGFANEVSRVDEAKRCVT